MGSVHSAALKSAEKGDVKAINKLLQRGDAKEWLNKEDGWTPLLKACINGHLEVVKLLVASGANVNCTDKSGWTPLYAACINGRLEVVKFLVSSGANINSTHKLGYTPLHEACINGHLEVVKFLESSGANVNCTDKDGSTPLHGACYHGHLKVVKFLLEEGANMNSTDKSGLAPLYAACNNGHLKVVKFLVSSGANINCTNKIGYTPLHEACKNGHLEIMKLLVSSGANINSTDKLGYTPLHEACKNGHLEIMKLLISSGANVNCTDKGGNTPLHWACYKGHLEVAKLLVSSGANVNSTDKSGNTPLHWACINGHLKVVKLLLEEGANATKRDKRGKLPVDYVSDKTKKAKVSRLLGSILLLKEENAKQEERQEKQRVEAEERERRRKELQEKEETAARQSEAEGLKLEADGEMYGGDLEKAVSLYSQCISNYSDSTVAIAALSNRSLAFLKLKMYDKARDDASAVLSQDPHNVEALYRRALAHEGASRFDKAVDDLDEVLKISPDNELAAEARSRVVQVRESLQLKLWGNESYREGDYETAVKHYSKAIRLDSSNATLYNNRAQAYLKAAQYLNAEADASQVISSGHRDGLLKAFHRRALARQGINTAESLQGALEDINRVMSSNPESKEAESEKQEIETALLELEAKKQREKEEIAARLKEQVLVGRETLDLFNARLMNLDSDDHKKLLTHQQRQGAEISHVRELLDSIDDKLKCLSPVDQEEQRLIRTTPVLSEYMQALQRHTHESLFIADALSAGLQDQTANLESDAVEVKAFRVVAKLCSGLPLIPTVLFGVAGGLNYLHQAKEKGGYSILLKLVSGCPVERFLFVEKLSRALTVTLMNDIIATENAKHDSNSKESTQCFLDKVKGVVKKMKDMAREKVAALDVALAEGLLSSQTKAELMACGHVTDLLEHVFAGELSGAEGDEEEVVARLVRHVAGSER